MADQIEEEWRPCAKSEGLFMISNMGQLKSLRTGKILSQNPIGRDRHGGLGYMAHITKIGGRNGTNVVIRIHVAVASAFVPNPDGKPFVNHKDGNKSHNSAENLEWVTGSENMIHAYRTGLASTPTPKRRLSNEVAISVKRRASSGETISALAREFGVHRKVLHKMIQGQTYKDCA